MANFAAAVPGNPFFMENLTNNTYVGEIKYSAADFRNYTWASNRREGVLGPGDFWVQQADNVGFSIKIMPGSAVVGKYLVTMTDAFTVEALGFAQNPGTTCTHRVYLVVYDEAYNANSAGYMAEFIGLESVNGSVVTPPTDTAGVLELCTITYKPGQSNVQNKDILNTRVHGGNTSSSFTLKLASGIVSAADRVSTSTPRCQYGAGTVRFAGAVRKSNGAIFPASSIVSVGTLSSSTLAPKRQRVLAGATSSGPGSLTYNLMVNTDATLTAVTSAGNGPLYLYLDGLSYDID